MGAPLLILALLLALVGCDLPSRPGDGGRTGAASPALVVWEPGALPADDAHTGMTCSACHNGPRLETGRASVPAAACAASGCHTDLGPARVQYGPVRFEHRRHGLGGEIEPSCAGCHTHPTGDAPLRASTDACALCHLPDVTGGATDRCQACHGVPTHTTLTSEGVPVPHAQLPWSEIGCVRCHYDVSEPTLAVPENRCSACHQRPEAELRADTAELHPRHAGVTCTACHLQGTHSIHAVSSAVSLVCADCHTQGHEVALAPWAAEGDRGWQDSRTCSVCHEGVHRPQQALLLGLLPDGRVLPARKFLIGMTCRSCHVPAPGDTPLEPIQGTALACAGCHPQGYDQVLRWWLDGVAERQRQTDAYVAAAGRRFGPAAPDSARLLLADAEAMLELVRRGGGQHNLELADRVFQESLRRVQQAYQVAGQRPPEPPRIGAPPHQGLCSGCHYSAGPWDIRAMPPGFHEEFVRDRDGR